MRFKGLDPREWKPKRRVSPSRREVEGGVFRNHGTSKYKNTELKADRLNLSALVSLEMCKLPMVCLAMLSSSILF